jgi:pimeloyl-ACP methyl ester carboxylesterase
MISLQRCIPATVAMCCATFIVSAQQVVPDKLFDSNGVSVRYIEQGTGQPLILLHGQGNNVDAAWVRTGAFANLARDHRVIAIDMRGHGKSGKPHLPQAYGEEMAST